MSAPFEADWLKRWNLYSPQSVAIQDADSGKSFTYQQLFETSNRLAHYLKNHYQIEKGDRVAALSMNELEYVALFFATQRLGAILVPINFRLTAREVAHILSDSEAKLLIHQRQFAGVVEQIRQSEPKAMPKALMYFDGADSLASVCESRSLPSDLHPMDDVTMETPCMILYTSGTTGAPKGAVITQGMIFWNSVNTTLRLNLSQSDATLSFLPFFHTGGWNVLTTPFLHRGARVILLKKFDPDRILKLCETEKVSILFGVPTMLDMMKHSPLFKQVDLSSVRYAIVGGEPMPMDLIRTWQDRGIPVRQGFGLTEFGPNVFSLNEEHSTQKIGSIGFPNFYIDAKIVDETGKDLGAEEIGELVLRGPMCTPGYWKNPEATAQTIRDGWLHTGDLVRRDAEGFYYVVGRKKDMYISGGENVYPAEIEQFLRTHPSIREVAVIGVQDEKWGEVGKAFIVTHSGEPIETAELTTFCQSNLAKYKIPKHFAFLSELPKGDSGKILKRALR
ncbi:MAG: o-succinylbenzoate--CoA ligase [Bdellovibrionia bacterium]